MEESAEGPGPDADAPATNAPEALDWGRLLDAAGIVAGIILLVIVADIWSDGQLVSRRLYPKGDNPGDNPAE